MKVIENPDCIEGLPPDEGGKCACGAGCTLIGYEASILPEHVGIEKTVKEKVFLQQQVFETFLRIKNKS